MFYSLLIMLENILTKNKKKSYVVFFLPDVTTKSYSERTEGWIDNAPKMEVNVGDKFELETFRPIVAYKSELEVCL